MITASKNQDLPQKSNVPPLSFECKKVHVVLNKPMTELETATRHIEVSQYGKIGYEEEYFIQNAAA